MRTIIALIVLVMLLMPYTLLFAQMLENPKQDSLQGSQEIQLTQTSKRICLNCGTVMTDPDIKFCPNCGHKFSESQQPKETAESKAKAGFYTMATWCLAGCLGVGLAVLIAFLIY